MTDVNVSLPVSPSSWEAMTRTLQGQIQQVWGFLKGEVNINLWLPHTLTGTCMHNYTHVPTQMPTYLHTGNHITYPCQRPRDSQEESVLQNLLEL